MSRDFSQYYEIIYDKFINTPETQQGRAALARFLGHGHDGKVRAWEKGQWPNAEDIATIHQRLGFSYRWLITGEGEPFDRDMRQEESARAENELLKVRLAELERENVELRARLDMDSTDNLRERVASLEKSLKLLTTRLLVDGVGDKTAATSIGKAAGGQG